MRNYIITFENTYRVLEAEKKITKEKVFSGATTIPTPEYLSSDCGVSLSVEFSGKKNDMIKILKSLGIKFTRIVKT